MAGMGRHQKFLFTPAHLIGAKVEDPKMYVTFNPQAPSLFFYRKGNHEVDGLPGKWVQLYADLEKKTLAWAFAPASYTKPEELKNYTQIKKYGKGEAYSVSLYIPSKISQALGMNFKFNKVEVQQYKPSELLDSNTYHYIDLTKIKHEQETKKEVVRGGTENRAEDADESPTGTVL